eukprot:CAMPEP_0114247138 /NCGR_PEP_ID=MMETSP0058-20121206/12860_1 /TAXON_ID=36894 /ORGANISM="Pyramimonas parkeae, CCMP726" /LENGTH=345 /DNA_ID=CAMNT_0001360419 /DNA_START=71 /DNA_END=1108 /DNA_ORIENTATION=+
MTTITSRSLAYRCTPSGLQGRQHSHRAVRSRAHTQKRSLTTCQIVESESPSLVDRVLKIFATPANSLNEGIATFYDESSGLWEDMWGEHMHHGYYEVGQPVKNHQEAQVDMIDNSLKWAGVDEVTSMLDVGCGIGGSSRHIARKFNCAATGITLSPKQAERANMITKEAKLENVQFQVADALNQPFPDNSFDFVWSMESGEHMPDKEKFIAELARVCKPGGRILIVTWCHRVLEEGETQLKPDEQALLKNICSAYYLPAWCSIADYARIATANNLSDIKTGDWSAEVQPFWGAVIQTALTPQGFTGLLKAGAGTLRGALVMPLMKTGLVKGTIKFNMMTAVKPST